MASATPAAQVEEPEALVVSHWFDPGGSGDPFGATVRLVGRRVGAGVRPGPGDSFTHDEMIEQVLPGSGPVSVTSWVYGLRPGEWLVSAQLIRPGDPSGVGVSRDRPRAVVETLPRARWSWRRWNVGSAMAGAVKTRWALLAPLAPQPAVARGSFTALAVLAIIAAFLAQGVLLADRGVAAGPPLAVSLLATLAGLIAAKLWYMVLQGRPWRETIRGGWSVDGFLVVAPAVAIVAYLSLALPVGVVLDATAPGIFLAVAIGRVGCFFTGCCAGRCTTAGWGIWSSDRRIGARRIPTQLLESGAGLVLAVVTGLLVGSDAVPVPGLVFVTSLAIYVLIRQGLLRLRAEGRAFSWQRSAGVRAQP